ncbi:MAG: protein kinase [Pseudomonadota bacterium]
MKKVAGWLISKNDPDVIMAQKRKTNSRIENFNFLTGRVLANKYEVKRRLGSGWEGEVYLLQEKNTGIERAAKFFFPHRNPNNRKLKFYAKKLHQLRHCPIMIPYHTQETIQVRNIPITFLVSDYVDGELLSEFLKRQPGGRLHIFQGLHLLHALAEGFDAIHQLKEYHGDLHSDNIIVQRYGLGFDLKLLDLYRWDSTRTENIQDDVCDMIRIFYDAIGGQRHYAKHPAQVKNICCGLKKSMIIRKFRTAGRLRDYLETMEWGEKDEKR